ncbi:MAG: type II toxin-antitoxin system VapC family toxin, partial [Anaerolineaceae bacterium]|nr:type II toxin-antitoxin system VapC family toxin [Anaerolineaceae bacterium]
MVIDTSAILTLLFNEPEADEVEKMKMDLLRVRFDEQVRTEKRRTAGSAIESQASSILKPWREVITPHKD